MIRKRLAWGLGGASVFLGSVLLGALLAPNSLLALIVNLMLPIPDVSAGRYDRALAIARYAPPPLRAEALRTAQDAAAGEIRAAPLSPDGWVRLAVARAVADNGPSRRAIAALEESYRAALCDRAAGPGRIRLALEAWPELPALDRQSALTELKTLYTTAEGQQQAAERRDLVDAVSGARQPAGRAAGEAALAAVGWTSASATIPRFRRLV